MIFIKRQSPIINKPRLRQVAFNIINGMRATGLFDVNQTNDMLNSVKADVLGTLKKVIDVLEGTIRICQK